MTMHGRCGGRTQWECVDDLQDLPESKLLEYFTGVFAELELNGFSHNRLQPVNQGSRKFVSFLLNAFYLVAQTVFFKWQARLF